jgi:hypothetical protein
MDINFKYISVILISILLIYTLSCNCIEGFNQDCPSFALNIAKNCSIDDNNNFKNCNDSKCRNVVENFFNNCIDISDVKENNKYIKCIDSGYNPSKNSPNLNTSNFNKCSFYINQKQVESYDECIKHANNISDNLSVCQGIEERVCQSGFPTTTIDTQNLSDSVNSNCINCKMDPNIRNMVCECKNDNIILPLSFCDENMKNIEYINEKLVKKCNVKYTDEIITSSIKCPYDSTYNNKDNECYLGGPFKKIDYDNDNLKLYLSIYDNKDLFLKRLKNAYNSETGNGVLLSMAVLPGPDDDNEDNIDKNIKFRMDGSGCIIRKNIYDKLFFPIAGTMMENIWMGYIWDTNFKTDKLDCLYVGDASTSYSGSDLDTRCNTWFFLSPDKGVSFFDYGIKCINNDKCIEQLFDKKKKLNKFIDENYNFITKESSASDYFIDILKSKYNEIVFSKYTYTYGIKDEDGLFDLYLKDIIPSALFLCYKTSITDDIFNFIGFLLNDKDKEMINHYKNIYHPSTYVVIISVNIDSYPISSYAEDISYGIINEIEDIIRLDELIDYF